LNPPSKVSQNPPLSLLHSLPGYDFGPRGLDPSEPGGGLGRPRKVKKVASASAGRQGFKGLSKVRMGLHERLQFQRIIRRSFGAPASFFRAMAFFFGAPFCFSGLHALGAWTTSLGAWIPVNVLLQQFFNNDFGPLQGLPTAPADDPIAYTVGSGLFQEAGNILEPSTVQERQNTGAFQRAQHDQIPTILRVAGNPPFAFLHQTCFQNPGPEKR